MNLSKRMLKVLRHAEQHKYPDFGGVLIADDKGYLSITGPSDDLIITITEKGREVIEQWHAENEVII